LVPPMLGWLIGAVAVSIRRIACRIIEETNR
jgi:hypothetical protein